MNVIFFGDSITQGLYGQRGGWSSRIKQDIYRQHLEKGEPMEDWNVVYQRGSASDTSRDLRRRISEELESGMANSSHSWTVVFSIGMNDCGISGGDYEVSKTEYRENVEEIIDRASHLADQVIAVGLSPVDEEELADNQEASEYLNSGVREYEEILEKACPRKGVKFIPTFDSLAEGRSWNQKLFDGLHPSTRGHQEIYDIVSNPIKSELEFEYSR